MIRRTGKRAAELWTATDAGGGGGKTKSESVLVSNIAAILSEQMQGFLNGSIGIREDHGVTTLRLVTHAMPGRHHENVALAPFDHDVLARAGRDDAAALALDRHEHRRIRRAVARGCKILWQQLDERRHGG